MRAAQAALSFDAQPRHVGSARRITAVVLGEAGVRDSDTIGTVQLLVSEIVTNAIVHGDADSVSFQITCDTAGEALIEVDDHSSGAPEVREAGPEDEGGRGMRLVTYFARDWGRKGTLHLVHGSGRAGDRVTVAQGRRPAFVLDPRGLSGDAVAEHIPTDTELLRLLLESLRRWQPAEPDDLP